MTAFLACYYLLLGCVVVPALFLGEVCEWSDEQTLKFLWYVLTRRIA